LIDTQGHQTQHVNRYLKGKGPTVQGIYGARTQGKPIITKSKKDAATGLRKWEIGTENAKTDIFQALQMDHPGPLYIHFPFCLTEEYFKELYSERKINGKFKQIGQRRNEKLDELGYNLAAYYISVKNFTAEQMMELLQSKPPECKNEIIIVETLKDGSIKRVGEILPQAPQTLPIPPLLISTDDYIRKTYGFFNQDPNSQF
jgi:phage terminase large subunit GpA-like protein